MVTIAIIAAAFIVVALAGLVFRSNDSSGRNPRRSGRYGASAGGGAYFGGDASGGDSSGGSDGGGGGHSCGGGGGCGGGGCGGGS